MVILEYPLNEVSELLFNFWLLLQGASQGEEAIEHLLLFGRGGLGYLKGSGAMELLATSWLPFPWCPRRSHPL